MADARDGYLDQFPQRRAESESPEVIEDLRHFRKRFDEGRPISIGGLIAYFERERGLTFRRYRLATIARSAGIEPWWSA